MMSEKDDALERYNSIKEYCETYNIPQENLLDILEDQKVLPMIRGKATEFIGAAILRKTLNSREWSVDKLNLNPQPGENYDEDVSITHKRTGIRLKAETKNAVRGSFRMKTAKSPAPHFRVKSHKSRSSLKKAKGTNDRYLVGEFDILLTNISNSIFKNKSLDRGLPLIENPEAIKWLKEHYGVKTDDELRRASYDDWRICLPEKIAEKSGAIPRTPRVYMIDDPDWFGLDQLENTIHKIERIRR